MTSHIYGTVERPEPGPSPFDKIRWRKPDGTEYWCARELAPYLGYPKWERMPAILSRAKMACGNLGYDTADHFRVASNMVDIGSGCVRNVPDHHLTRLGCYLTAMNGDPRKPEVAAAQRYFVGVTRAAETAPPAETAPSVQAIGPITGAGRPPRDPVKHRFAGSRPRRGAPGLCGGSRRA